jgi:hypothetical protein
VSFAAVTICVASQRVFIVVVYFVIDSVPKLCVQNVSGAHPASYKISTGGSFSGRTAAGA